MLLEKVEKVLAEYDSDEDETDSDEEGIGEVGTNMLTAEDVCGHCGVGGDDELVFGFCCFVSTLVRCCVVLFLYYAILSFSLPIDGEKRKKLSPSSQDLGTSNVAMLAPHLAESSRDGM